MKVQVKFRKSNVPGKTGGVYYQLTHSGVVRQIASGIRLSPEQWEATRMDAVRSADGTGRGFSPERHRIVGDLLALDRIVRNACGMGRTCSADDVAGLFRTRRECVTVFGFIREQISRLTETGRLGTARNYTRTLNSFTAFLGNSDLPFEAFTEELVEEYALYLERRGVVRNTVSFYMRVLRSVYNKAVRARIVEQRFPFCNVYTGVDRTRKKAVGEETIASLSRLDLSGSQALSLARDLFVFSYCTRGMAFVDLAYLRKSDISGGVIGYVRRKTGRKLFIRLEPCMERIIGRYALQTRDSPYVFPILTTEERTEAYAQYQAALGCYNRLLKKLTRLLQTDSCLSSYTPRHSWATAARNHNVPLSVISAGMGHASERTTQIYLAALENSVIDSANRRILDSIDGVLSL